MKKVVIQFYIFLGLFIFSMYLYIKPVHAGFVPSEYNIVSSSLVIDSLPYAYILKEFENRGYNFGSVSVTNKNEYIAGEVIFGSSQIPAIWSSSGALVKDLSYYCIGNGVSEDMNENNILVGVCNRKTKIGQEQVGFVYNISTNNFKTLTNPLGSGYYITPISINNKN